MKKEFKISIFAVAVPLTVYFFMKAISFIFSAGEESPEKGILLLVLIFLAWIVPLELVRAKKQVQCGPVA